MKLGGLSTPVSRRTVVVGAAAAAAAAAAASGCASARSAERRGQTGGTAAGTVLGSPADIPVGGGAVVAEHQVVVTQPTAGVFRAFSAICTHQGCTVIDLVDSTINCPCHGSQFDIADGSVTRGPAKEPLGQVSITVTADSVTVS